MPVILLSISQLWQFVTQQPNSSLGHLTVAVSRSPTIRQKHPVELLWTSDQLVAEPLPTQQTQDKNIHALSENRTSGPCNQAASDLHLRPHGKLGSSNYENYSRLITIFLYVIYFTCHWSQIWERKHKFHSYVDLCSSVRHAFSTKRPHKTLGYSIMKG